MTADQERRIREEIKCTGAYLAGVLLVSLSFLDDDSWWR